MICFFREKWNNDFYALEKTFYESYIRSIRPKAKRFTIKTDIHNYVIPKTAKNGDPIIWLELIKFEEAETENTISAENNLFKISCTKEKEPGIFHHKFKRV